METCEKLLRRGNVEQRFIWFIINYDLWRDIPDRPKWKSGDYGPFANWLKRDDVRKVFRAMKADGVISQTTDIFGVQTFANMMDAIRYNKQGLYNKYIGHLENF